MNDDTKQACDRICGAIRELGWIILMASFGLGLAINVHGCMVSQTIQLGA